MVEIGDFLTVGHAATPFSTILLATAASNFALRSLASHEQCSMQSNPASTARSMPSVPMACVVMGMPHLCASSAKASISACEYRPSHTCVPAVMKPPVAMALTRSAPSALRLRTSSRHPSTPAHSPPMEQACPPGTVSGALAH